MRTTPALAILLLALGGCVEHAARVEPPVGGGAIAAGRRVADPHPAALSERHALPRELPVSAWRHEDDGGIARDELVLRTPTPWWQRFPCDLISDAMVPSTLVVATTATPRPQPIAPTDPELLATRARAAGYAGPAPAP